MPHVEPLKLIALLKTVRRNPLEAWTRAHFEEPVVINRVAFGEVAVVSAPAAIRHVLVDNVANYRKDNLQRRMLASLSSGILTAEASACGCAKERRQHRERSRPSMAAISLAISIGDKPCRGDERRGRGPEGGERRFCLGDQHFKPGFCAREPQDSGHRRFAGRRIFMGGLA